LDVFDEQPAPVSDSDKERPDYPQKLSCICFYHNGWVRIVDETNPIQQFRWNAGLGASGRIAHRQAEQM
jgi:hypothetical protein